MMCYHCVYGINVFDSNVYKVLAPFRHSFCRDLRTVRIGCDIKGVREAQSAFEIYIDMGKHLRCAISNRFAKGVYRCYIRIMHELSNGDDRMECISVDFEICSMG